jgi:sugar phosphate permease
MADSGASLATGTALYRRVAVWLISFLVPCYIVAMIDRLNVGYAKLQFMGDLHFDEAVFGVAAGSLYVGYVLFEVPSNLALQRSGLRLTLLRIMSLWGLFTMALAFASTRWNFYLLRFLVGAAEAGFFPGLVYYSTLWFPSWYRGRVLSWIALAVPVSGVLAGPLSGQIMTRLNEAGGLRGWQWLFLLEGAPAILLGVAAYFFLPDRPANAKFLSAAERERIARDLAQDEAPVQGAATFRQVLGRPRTYALAGCYFAFYSAQSILLIWVPTLLRNAGVRDLVEIGWRSALIFLAGAAGMVAIGWSSDRCQERRWHLVGSGSVASAAFLLLAAAAGSADATTACLVVAAVTMFAFLALFWTLPTALFGSAARAGGIALVSSIGAVGSALSPVLIGWTQVWTGSLFGAVRVLALVFLASLVVVYRHAPARAVRA